MIVTTIFNLNHQLRKNSLEPSTYYMRNLRFNKKNMYVEVKNKQKNIIRLLHRSFFGKTTDYTENLNPSLKITYLKLQMTNNQ